MAGKSCYPVSVLGISVADVIRMWGLSVSPVVSVAMRGAPSAWLGHDRGCNTCVLCLG